MDENKIWYYLVLGIIYFVFNRFFKKTKERPDADPERSFSETKTEPTEKPLSFEELLREITEGKKQANQPPPKPVPTTQYVNYDDDIDEEEQDLEDVNYDYKNQDKIYETYEKAKNEAFQRPSLEETMNLEPIGTFGRFQEFEDNEKNTVLSEYSEAFNDPEGVKKAFVLSEIFNRKYTWVLYFLNWPYPDGASRKFEHDIFW